MGLSSRVECRRACLQKYSHPLSAPPRHSSCPGQRHQRRGRPARLLHAQPRGRAGFCLCASWPCGLEQAGTWIGCLDRQCMRLRYCAPTACPDVGISLRRGGTMGCVGSSERGCGGGAGPWRGGRRGTNRLSADRDSATRMKIGSGDLRWSNHGARIRRGDERGRHGMDHPCREGAVPRLIPTRAVVEPPRRRKIGEGIVLLRHEIDWSRRKDGWRSG